MNKLKKIIFIIISFQLILGQTLYALPPTSAVVNQTRTTEHITTMMQSSDPSDIPFVDYSDSFTAERTLPIIQHDLSPFSGKKVYIGYGLYDGENKYCKYVESPTAPTTPKIDLVFKDIKTFNGHSYGLFRTGATDYNSCETKSLEYGGIVATPTTAAENSFLHTTYPVKKWLGISKIDCTEEYYYNMERKDQTYTNWGLNQDTGECIATKLNVIQGDGFSWEKVNDSDSYSCVIEVNSPDLKRPIKICAPWWRIERTYTKDKNYDINGINILNINKADIPELYNVCTKYNASGIVDANASELREEFHCTTYYDYSNKPECMYDIFQPQCKVSECKGYVEEACFHKKEVTPYKDYVKTVIKVNGMDREIKGKDRIRTQVYDCPVVVPTNKDCLEKSTVLVYPKECPGSECDTKKECYSEAVDSTDLIACDNTYICEKKYPNTSITPGVGDLNAAGELIKMHAMCADNSVLDFEVNIQSKLNRSCVEYSRITKTTEIVKKCTLERPYEDYSLDMSITAIDDYENDNKCIRTNNIITSRPPEDILFDIQGNNYTRNVIKKIYIDGTVEDVSDFSTSTYLEIFATEHVTDTVTQNGGSTTPGNSIGGCPLDLSGAGSPDKAWADKYLTAIIRDSAIQTYTGGATVDMLISSLTTNATCDTFKTEMGAGATNLGYNPCNIRRPATVQDKIFFEIRKTGETGPPASPTMLMRYTSNTTTYNGTQCNDWAKCMGSTGAVNGAGRCVANTSSTSSVSTPVPSIPGDGTTPDVRPPQITTSEPNRFEGVGSIFYIADIVDGTFGYTSNYLMHPYKDNKVSINGLEAFPITKISEIRDGSVAYLSVIKQDNITTKEPNILAGAIGGAAAGAAYIAYQVFYSLAIVMPVLGAIIVVVAVIVAIVFAEEEYFNQISIYWKLYKDIDKGEYIFNAYGFDTRRQDDHNSDYRMVYAIGGEHPNRDRAALASKNYWWKSFTGTLENTETQKMLDNLFTQKKMTFSLLGYPVGTVPSTPGETGLLTGTYPECDWDDFSCDKHGITVEDGGGGSINEGSSGVEVSADNKIDKFVPKQMSTFYMGATNKLNVFVPYMGDYEFEAYDKNGELLGSIIVHEDEFIGETATNLTSAKVNFGLVMSIAANVDEGNIDKGCRDVYMVEWGGGVSGVYVEEKNAGGALNAACDKSNDNYVLDHSMTKLQFRPTNQDDWYIIELDKPMPFANRIGIVSLNNKEIREYRCYADFDTCLEDDFIVQGGE